MVTGIKLGSSGTKKYEKGHFWLFFEFLTPWFALESLKSCGYMTTRVRHLNTNSADDLTDPAQLIARRVKQGMVFILWQYCLISLI